MNRLQKILLLMLLLLAACATPRGVETPAANPDAPAATTAPMPRLSGDDAPTRRTNALLAAVGANDTDALKPMDHGAMDSVDHSNGNGTKARVPGATDHSQHGAQPRAAAGNKAFVCPMHPEVTAATPAKCPKCGMALKAKPSPPGGASHQDHHP